MGYNAVQETLHFIRNYTDFQPQVAIILGTGLGNLTDDLLIAYEIEYRDLPHFPVSTVASHKGKLVFGYLEGKAVVVMAGRFHYYEGYSMAQITFPVRVLRALGAQELIITNVSGGTNADYEAGDLVLVRDHINLMGDNPLRGENDERLGVRFPDMLEAYSPVLRAKMHKIAREKGIALQEGTYVALAGPNLETPAEYRFLNTIGGDLVGMSSVPEAIVARHAGFEVLMLSLVSNKCFPIESIKKTSLESVIAVAQKSEVPLRQLVRAYVAELA
jgi:purine-nucleoside phosphorylase